MHLRTRSNELTLQQLCLERIVHCISPTKTTQEPNSTLFPEIRTIPLDVSQDIFDFCIRETGAEDVNNTLRFFLKNPSHTQLKYINLQNARQADVHLIHSLVKANLNTLTHLDVRGCRTLPKKFWSALPKAFNLYSLKTTNLLIPLRCPNLEVLVVDWKPKSLLEKFQRHLHSMYYDKLLENVLPNLTYLDLSWCPWTKRLRTLRHATALEALILRNCDVSNLVDDITQLNGLRILDISIGLEQDMNHDFDGKYSNPKHILKKIVSSLTQLEYLDISGTNLAATRESGSFLLALETRRDRPFTFLGIYSTTFNEYSLIENIPALHVAGSWNSEVLIETIKRNVDMPKTLRNQISRLKTIGGSSSVNTNMLLGIQIEMLKNLRVNEHSRFWALKTLSNFLDQMENPVEQISRETCRELFLVLNRLNHSHTEFEKVAEQSLRFTFQIFLKLLPAGEIKDDGIRREVMRLGVFLVTLNRKNFVYFKTEAILFRLLHRLSLEPWVCAYLCENSVVVSCFDFFKTIQVYLGFSLRVPQTSEIVRITWSSILSFMQISQNATSDFFKYRGLSWMYAHFSWFSYDVDTQQELKRTFERILNLLETNDYARNQQARCTSYKLMYKVRDMITAQSPN